MEQIHFLLLNDNKSALTWKRIKKKRWKNNDKEKILIGELAQTTWVRVSTALDFIYILANKVAPSFFWSPAHPTILNLHWTKENPRQNHILFINFRKNEQNSKKKKNGK